MKNIKKQRKWRKTKIEKKNSWKKLIKSKSFINIKKFSSRKRNTKELHVQSQHLSSRLRHTNSLFAVNRFLGFFILFRFLSNLFHSFYCWLWTCVCLMVCFFLLWGFYHMSTAGMFPVIVASPIYSLVHLITSLSSLIISVYLFKTCKSKIIRYCLYKKTLFPS